MPTIEQNNELWDEKYEWPEQGDEWSRAWGGVSSQWFGTLLPRLKSFVPASTILEIAPGFGRWTQFLRPLCSKLVLVDVSPKCIAACQRRFAGNEGIQYHVNDGQSLAMVADESVDFAFSFDSLVHVEAPVLVGYLEQLARKLAPHGVGFLHHSNIGAFVNPGTGELADGMVNRHWRAQSVSAELVRQACNRNALVCLSQEIVNWGGHDLTDTISVVTRTGSKWGQNNVVRYNADFMREAEYLSRTRVALRLGPARSRCRRQKQIESSAGRGSRRAGTNRVVFRRGAVPSTPRGSSDARFVSGAAIRSPIRSDQSVFRGPLSSVSLLDTPNGSCHLLLALPVSTESLTAFTKVIETRTGRTVVRGRPVEAMSFQPVIPAVGNTAATEHGAES